MISKKFPHKKIKVQKSDLTSLKVCLSVMYLSRYKMMNTQMIKPKFVVKKCLHNI